MMRLLFILTSFIIAAELEVEGNLTVTESVNASSFTGDGSGLTNISALGGMKPDRIYTLISTVNGESYSITVPEGKIWKILLFNEAECSDNTIFKIGNDGFYLYYGGTNRASVGGNEFWLPSGKTMSSETNMCNYVINVFEYSVSNSGTDQGMDYVEP